MAKRKGSGEVGASKTEIGSKSKTETGSESESQTENETESERINFDALSR